MKTFNPRNRKTAAHLQRMLKGRGIRMHRGKPSFRGKGRTTRSKR